MSKAFVTTVSDVAASTEKSKQYILVTCRSCTDDEKKVLSKNFKSIVVYNSSLNSGNVDLSKMHFDLLVIDLSCSKKKENHVFLEIVTPMAKSLNIPIIVLKRTLSNYVDLVEALEGFVLSKIPLDLEGQQFLNALVKKSLPKLNSSCSHLFNKLFSFLSKQ